MIDALTHRRHEDRICYWDRIAACFVACLVKWADIRHNMNSVRLAFLSAEDREWLRVKYGHALAAITQGDEEEKDDGETC